MKHPDPQAFSTALSTLHPQLSTGCVEALAGHHRLLAEWNQTHNLTRVEDPEQAASVHYLDSLLPLLALPAPRKVVDLGSGTGLPGMAAAALWPEAEVVLVETVAKKCSFLRTVRALVPALRCQVVQGRSERLEPLQADLVVTRATFPWALVPGHASRHLAPGGQLLAYIGREAPQPGEWAQICAEAGLRDASIEAYTLPPEGALRHLGVAFKG